MHRFTPVSEERVGRRHVRSGGGNPVHTIDVRQAYGRRVRLAPASPRMSHGQRWVTLSRDLREPHYSRHKPQSGRIVNVELILATGSGDIRLPAEGRDLTG